MSDTIHRPTSARLPIGTMLRMRGIYLDRDDEAGGGGAGTVVTDEEKGSSRGDDENSFINRMAAKYEKADRASADAEDGVESDAVEDEPAEDADDEDDAEHPEVDTSTEAEDEPSDESTTESVDDDNEEHPDDADAAETDSPEDADDPDDDDPDEVDDEENDEPSALTKTALTARGADLTLSDVPEKYRPIIEKKVKAVDAAFTRVMQEATAYRPERTQFLAEKKFREENPEMVIVEMLRKDPLLFDKVDALNATLGDETVARAFGVVLKDKRAAAIQAIEAEVTGAEKFEARIAEVEGIVAKRAAELGVPEWIADQAVGNVVSNALREKRDATNDEIAAAIAGAAKKYLGERRGQKREQSKETIKSRAEGRRVAPPANKKPAAAASPGAPGQKKKQAVDWKSEDSRVNRILETTRRVKPGAR